MRIHRFLMHAAGLCALASPAFAETAVAPMRALIGRALGLEAVAPVAAPAGAPLARIRSTVAAASDPDARASGLIVRFRSAEAQALARDNLAPPAGLRASIEAAVAPWQLDYQRAMSGGRHVFRFSAAIPLDEARALAARLAALPEVEDVAADALSRRQAVSIDPFYTVYQWSLRGTADGYPGGIDAKSAWLQTTGSAQTVVAVIDTGILAHPEFASRILPGFDFVSNPAQANDGDGLDGDPTDAGDWVVAGECGEGALAEDSSWHGTHVAGIVAADGANVSGIAGVAWQTRLLPVRVLGKCGGSTSDIADAIQWAAGLAVPGAPLNPNPAHVINLSLSGFSPEGCDRSYQEAINQALGQGALLVVAAGNQEADAALYTPANCEGVLTVVAVDHLGELASYSNFSFTGHLSAPGGDINVYGPGGGIYSTVGSGSKTPGFPTWKSLQGTSMAAPHVSGIAALALAMNPELSGPELNFLLQFSTAAFPANTFCASSGICGSGIANAPVAVGAAEILGAYKLVYEFYNVDLNHYFRTGGKNEAASVNRGGAGPGWFDTQGYFYAWRGPEDGAVPVCRFYGTPGVGPNSHFYTAGPNECAKVKNDPGWTYEGIPFYAKRPSAGVCPADSVPVYRAYNNRFAFNDSNHRYSTDPAIYQAMLDQGWLGEGVALCVAF